VDRCQNGQEALYYLDLVRYHVAIMDIMMPEMDGITAVKRLRANGNLTPVIFLPARDTVADKVKGLDIGANDYLVKPFSFDKLTARIRAATRAASANPTNIYSLADLTLDLESHIVKRSETEISLSAREYALLEYLLLNMNKILSRQKTDESYSTKLIHTVCGIGYIMKDEK